METIETTFTDLEKTLEKLKDDVYDAIAPIIAKVQIPIQIDVYSIDIPILQTTCIGRNTKDMVADRPQINVSLSIV